MNKPKTPFNETVVKKNPEPIPSINKTKDENGSGSGSGTVAAQKKNGDFYFLLKHP